MANEIQLDIGSTGITGLVARTLTGTTLGSPIALSEVSGAGGVYVGTMTGGAGEYVLKAYDSVGTLIASSDRSYRWSGSAFVDPLAAVDLRVEEIYQRQGLDPSAPVTRTKAGDTVTETFGDVTITHETNGTDTVTSTRS